MFIYISISFDADTGLQCTWHCGWDKTNSHGLPNPVEKKGWYSHSLKGRVLWPLSGVESASILALTGFYWLSNNIHQRRFSFIVLRFTLGNYFLQIATERMLLITSYRLTKKKCCKWKGTIRVIGLVAFQSLGELAQTSGTQGDGVLARGSHKAASI